MTDKEYERLFARSPQEAQNVLFDRYFNYVYTIVFNKLRSCAAKEDIEECVSDVFADIFAYFADGSKQNENLKGFISTVAIRKAINMFHSLTSKSGRTVSLEEEDTENLRDDTDIAQNAERAELRRTLLRLVDELGEPDSTIIIQKYYYGMNSKEIAETVSLEPAAVRVRCSRAIKRLKDKLAELDISLKEAES
ncbi:RNA polymerase sigma factor [Ruminococcus flavefaciens]|uniref:RNA polymerase sigma-70 factor, ECF subfamily n=1 Tax=Ruminococcus flavefaciens TaxID=1265 RepID=A0A1M7LMU6_RUMFL|nr:sigma-70 family RNA polymerase sigma factor [Ruminococcus flavefaciens]SHM78966.1 RNA polymerase sigma-70 factor, ECF subfamily [Ruminococcus flavefaciens]